MPQALTIRKVDGKPGEVYYPLQLNDVPKPTPGPGEVLVRIHSAALNHRDHWIRKAQYPAISFTAPMFADGFGTVVAVGDSSSHPELLNKTVILSPSHGWISQPEGPEDPRNYAILGSCKLSPVGMAQDYVLVTKTGNAEKGRNILITGIGGGVALAALQFAVAKGCNVYVTSGSPDKIESAKKLGAVAGVSYKAEKWDKDLVALLPADRPFIDAVVDGAGGDIIRRAGTFLKPGGVIAQYGMTVSPKMEWSMAAVLKNIELKGSTMGSRKEFLEMVQFVRESGVRPVVSKVAKGLNNLEGVEGLFKDMAEGKQFGKLVLEISPVGESSKL
ncbi:unnamed protein product [Parascedosporium putredinis]|uniref:Enoyl reductase (ER) domain-containing protein n=1 Tax=Parascedosporium putredinis TaxID=1442378 RepID=A0A9P1H6E4_9PEZI|nr:unnamed protein product [Parascedosporium putredinis]CAI7998745.1 unnamed protein product [Parascedosporium putredinis]